MNLTKGQLYRIRRNVHRIQRNSIVLLLSYHKDYGPEYKDHKDGIINLKVLYNSKVYNILLYEKFMHHYISTNLESAQINEY